MTLRLMVRARWRAYCHLMQNANFAHGHRIWRLYRFGAWPGGHGFETLRVFCECGKDFQ